MHLELYHREECPFSAKVRNFIQKDGLKSKIKYHDIEKEVGSVAKLRGLTGDDQVPCLVIDGRPMLESDLIVDWLEVHKSEL